MPEPVIDLGEAFARTAPPQEKVLQTDTAMIIFVDPQSGRWIIDSDIFNPQHENFGTKIVASRVATYSDFHAALGAVQHDLMIKEMVQQMMMAQAQLGRNMMEQMKTQQVAERIQQP